jgi:hypothetical protein
MVKYFRIALSHSDDPSICHKAPYATNKRGREKNQLFGYTVLDFGLDCFVVGVEVGLQGGRCSFIVGQCQGLAA